MDKIQLSFPFPAKMHLMAVKSDTKGFGGGSLGVFAAADCHVIKSGLKKERLLL